MFQNSGQDHCPFHAQVLIEWRVTSTEKHPLTTFALSCPALIDGMCRVEEASCPTEKVIECIGLSRLRKFYDKHLRGGIFGRRPQAP